MAKKPPPPPPPLTASPGMMPYLEAIKQIAGDDREIAKALIGGGEMGQLLFQSNGGLGRVDEGFNPDLIELYMRHKGESYLQPTQELVDLRKSQLGGLNSQEMTAAREQGQIGINRGRDSALRSLKTTQLGGGPRGAASLIGAIPITAQYADAQAGMERQLVLDNYGAKQQALGNYENAVQANIKDRRSRLDSFTNFYGNLRADLYSRQLENLNRINAEKSGFASTMFGAGAFRGEQLGRKESYELGKMNIEAQKKLFGSSGTTGATSTGFGGGGGSKSGSQSEDVFG